MSLITSFEDKLKSFLHLAETEAPIVKDAAEALDVVGAVTGQPEISAAGAVASAVATSIEAPSVANVESVVADVEPHAAPAVATIASDVVAGAEAVKSVI